MLAELLSPPRKTNKIQIMAKGCVENVRLEQWPSARAARSNHTHTPDVLAPHFKIRISEGDAGVRKF